MSQQLNYYDNPPAAIAGLVAGQEGTVIWSKISQALSGLLPGVGMLVSPGSNGITAPSASSPLSLDGHSAGEVTPYPASHTDDPVLDLYAMGVAIFDPALMATDQVSAVTDGTFSYGAYKAGQAVGVLRKGRIWVLADAATTQFNPAYVYTTHETNQPLGSFGAAAGTGKSKWARGQWLMTTASAGLSLLEVW